MNQKDIDIIQTRIKKFKTANIDNSQTHTRIDPFTIAIDLVSSMMVSAIIGIVLDKIFTSTPLCFIICALIGILAGFKIIWQKLNNANNDI